MKALFDLAPALVFFAAYYFSGIYAATVALIVALFAVVLVIRVTEKRWHRLHLFGALAALVLGGITLALRDPVFIKLKPSIVYGVLALVLLGSHWVGERVLLQRIPQKMVVMPDALWRRVNAAWAGFFLLCALLNYHVAQSYDEATWVKLKAFGFSLLMMAFLLAHLPFLSRYLVADARAEKP